MRGSEFKLRINRRDLAEIVDGSKQLRITDQDFIKNASYDDVHAAYYIMALKEFMEQRNVSPEFDLVLSE